MELAKLLGEYISGKSSIDAYEYEIWLMKEKVNESQNRSTMGRIDMLENEIRPYKASKIAANTSFCLSTIAAAVTAIYPNIGISPIFPIIFGLSTECGRIIFQEINRTKTKAVRARQIISSHIYQKRQSNSELSRMINAHLIG